MKNENVIGEVVIQLALVSQTLAQSRNALNNDSAGKMFKKISQCDLSLYQGEFDPVS